MSEGEDVLKKADAEEEKLEGEFDAEVNKADEAYPGLSKIGAPAQQIADRVLIDLESLQGQILDAGVGALNHAKEVVAEIKAKADEILSHLESRL